MEAVPNTSEGPIGSTVLIVDDDEDIREILTQYLEREGYAVATAANGLQAVNYVNDHAVRPGVVLLDIMMPMMNGWEFLEVRKTHEKLSRTPVIVMSANLELIKLSEIRHLDRIAKPFDMNRLMALVSKWVRNTPAPRSESIIPAPDSSDPPPAAK